MATPAKFLSCMSSMSRTCISTKWIIFEHWRSEEPEQTRHAAICNGLKLAPQVINHIGDIELRGSSEPVPREVWALRFLQTW